MLRDATQFRKGIGTRDNLFDINGSMAGVAICFEIVDDGLVRQMIAGGADVIIAPTNNAGFGRNDESMQHHSIARMRAMETGRSVVNIFTVESRRSLHPTAAHSSSCRLLSLVPWFRTCRGARALPWRQSPVKGLTWRFCRSD